MNGEGKYPNVLSKTSIQKIENKITELKNKFKELYSQKLNKLETIKAMNNNKSWIFLINNHLAPHLNLFRRGVR